MVFSRQPVDFGVGPCQAVGAGLSSADPFGQFRFQFVWLAQDPVGLGDGGTSVSCGLLNGDAV